MVLTNITIPVIADHIKNDPRSDSSMINNKSVTSKVWGYITKV